MYYASIANRGTGFTNQIFALITSIILAYNRGDKVIVVDGFLDDIHSTTYTPISQVLNLPACNLFLKKYGLRLMDKHDEWELLSVRYGMTTYVDLTDYFKRTHEPIPPFNTIQGDPCPGVVKHCIFTYRVDGNVVEEIYPEHRYKDVRSPYVFTFGWMDSLNEPMFMDVLRHLTYHPKVVEKAQSVPAPMNVVHLRVEDDAIAHWSKQNHMPPNEFKTYLEDKYIHLCKTYLAKEDRTVIVSASSSNRVLDFLRENQYSYTLTPKFFKEREKNAMVDLHIASQCTKLFLGNFNVKNKNGSSFSYYISTRLANQVSHVYLDLDNITDPEVHVPPETRRECPLDS